MTPGEARRRFAGAAVARLASVDITGRPHLVPITFALEEDRVYSAVDAKRKRSVELQRLANVRANPVVALLVDHYDDDWDALWWVRADGHGRVLDPEEPEAREGAELLAQRYPRFQQAGAVLAIDVERWTGWSATDL